MCTMTTCFFVLPLTIGVHMCVTVIMLYGLVELLSCTILMFGNYPLKVTDTLEQAIILYVLFVIYYIMVIADMAMHGIMSYATHLKNENLMLISVLYAGGKTASEVLRTLITNTFFYVNTGLLFVMTILRCFFLVVEYSYLKELEHEEQDNDESDSE